MNAADRSELERILQECCDPIAESWYQAIAQTSYVPHSAAKVRQHLGELTEQAIALLLTDPLEHGRAEAIGASLARLHCIEPEVLGRTQQLLAQQLVEGMPAGQVLALQPRLAALLGGLAAGFFQQARETILAEQAQIRGAVISELQRTEGALRKAYDEVERRVQERTAELAAVNEKLWREIAERKQAEEMLRKSHEELERRVDKRTAELATANEQLKQEIEERKRMEEALRESEETARALLNAPTDVAALIDTSGIILDANETMAHRFGKCTDELAGSCIWDLFPPDVSERRRAYVDGVIQSGIPVRFEDEREGMWNDSVIYPVLDTQGQVTTAAILARDITERKQAEEALRHYSERLKTLYELDQAILAARSPEAIAQAALHHVRRLVPCPGGAVTIFDLATSEATVLVAQVNGEPVVEAGMRLSLEEFKGAKEFIESLLQGEIHVVDDLLAIPQPPPVLQTLQAEGLRSLLNVPLVAEDELIGFLSLGVGNPGPCAPKHVDIAREVAGPLAIAIQQAQLFEQVRTTREQLRRLAQQMVSAQEKERRRLSRALHDEAGQALTALKISLELIEEDLPAEFGSLRQRLGDAAALTTTTMEQIRLLAQDLRPPALDAVGLNPTMEGFCRDFARRTQLSIDYLGLELPMLREAVNTCLYRFLQEALTNVAKHACADHVRVALRRDAETVSLSVEDDGRGFDRQARLSVSGWPMGIGLLGMQERLESLGGHLEIESRPGQGTRLVAYLPAGGIS
jgi:PAS domain S-box-containing protein